MSKRKLVDAKNRVARKVVTVGTAISLAVGSAMPCLAADGTTATVSETMKTALGEALNSMVADFTGYVALVLPIGLTVFGAVWGIKKAKTFFKNMANG